MEEITEHICLKLSGRSSTEELNRIVRAPDSQQVGKPMGNKFWKKRMSSLSLNQGER